MENADFEIKRKKGKGKSKRRHTVCEGDNKELQEALQNITMVHSSCQTEGLPEPTTSLFSFRRSFSRKKRASDAARRETVALEELNLDLTKRDEEVPPERTAKKSSSKGSLMSSLSAAISLAVKMRHPKSKPDDGRSSSGNWSASSSARASLDSEQHHAVSLALDRNSNVSRNSAGRDSVLSDATTATAQPESVRPPEHLELPKFTSARAKALKCSSNWDFDNGRDSNTSTPERTSDCASTPLVMSPYIRRKHHYAASTIDDGESSVYSVDTDGYYTSMHTDSGLWNALNGAKSSENQGDTLKSSRKRQESQSSVSTIGNGSINSFLSKVVTENDNSSSCSSLKREEKPVPEPPPRVSSFQADSPRDDNQGDSTTAESKPFEKESSPTKNGSASESDYESRDRIRVKTTINPSRYPSLCTVSPETSDDDELSEMRTELPKKSIVVVEVHREDNRDANSSDSETSACTSTKSDAPSNAAVKNAVQPSYINMYGGHSPTGSSFASILQNSKQNATSTPKKKGAVSSFTSDPLPVTKERGSPSLVQKLVSDLKSIPSPKKDIIATSSPVAAKQESKTMIPLKYAQRITVTPIVRNEGSENNKNLSNTPPTRSKSFLKNPLSSLPFRHGDASSPKPKSPSYISFQSPDSPVSSSTSLSPELGKTSSTPTTKAIARVTLDPTGKVIYSSSSLDRTTKDNRCAAGLQRNEPKYATLPKYQPSPQSSNNATDGGIRTNTTPVPSRGTSIPVFQGRSQPQPQYSSDSQNTSKSPSMLFRPSRGGRFCRTYFPSHIISSAPQCTPPGSKPSAMNPARNSPSNSSLSQTLDASPRIPTSSSNTAKYSTLPSANRQNSRSSDIRASPSPKPQTRDCYSAREVGYRTFIPPLSSTSHFRPVTASPEVAIDNSFSNRSRSRSPLKASVLSSPSKDIVEYIHSRSPSSTLLLKQDTYERAGSPGKVTSFTPTNPPDVIPSSSTPPSTLDVTARTVRRDNLTSKPPPDPSSLKSMSSSELFAIIHSSKKKHNIKSESERSLSPMSSRSSSPGICLTPSPVKTPKIETGVLTRLPRDRSSTPTEERRSRPTSMHDFKMLLLQTRVGGNEPGTRPSAAELLKVSPPRGSGRSSPSTLPRLSPKLPTPKRDPAVGHGTVPVKRLARTRSPYLTRYDSTYPPIWEDCSEDTEEADENQNRLMTRYAPSKQYSSNANCAILDNEKPNAQSTSTWV